MLLDLIDQILLRNNHRSNQTDNKPTTTPSTMSSSATADSKQPATCPVDHKSREAWLEKARESSSSSAVLPPEHQPIDNATKTGAESCPVDHGAREVWMQQARAAGASSQGGRDNPSPTSPTSQQSTSSWSSYIPRIPYFSSSSSSPTKSTPLPKPTSSLGTDREVSTIPRTTTQPQPQNESPTPTPALSSSSSPSSSPANHEQETGADSATGNWVYPSERMFFDAMKRKGHDPRTADMRTVVPIHNAVNERAWAEIKAWEGPWVAGTSCQGPRLHSFSGLSTQLSPRARFNTFLGYQAPFDRHDWVVDRCGKEIEYVIDFYAGRNGGAGGGPGPDGKLSFYLDVRPKLNSWEGVKMRASRFLGLS
ncbi:cytochrome c/c1 heme-lyase [Xylariaceae sp. FL0255]|nr:cytochrome c/c1 heme-lyase [Xylariaceae sp. FL0255]